MKLIHLLWQELTEWPEGCDEWYITQDYDGEVNCRSLEPFEDADSDNCVWIRQDGSDTLALRVFDTIAEDYQTVVITKKDWLEYKNHMDQLEQSSRFLNKVESSPEVDTTSWKIYPIQIEVVDDTGDFVMRMETQDSYTCTIDIKTVVGKDNVDKLCEMIKRGITMLELE